MISSSDHLKRKEEISVKIFGAKERPRNLCIFVACQGIFAVILMQYLNPRFGRGKTAPEENVDIS